MRPLRVLTWHVHGNYLWYMTQARHEFYLPVRADHANGYGGRGTTFPLGGNVHDVPADEVKNCEFDCVLFQSRVHYEEDQYRILTPAQRRLPRIYIQHEPPLEDPVNQKHWVDDPNVLLVHCTHFNQLMWDNGRSPTRVIEHGIITPDDATYDGSLARGLTIVNHLRRRGRNLGADVFATLRERVPLDLVGMAAEELGGLGEVPPPELARFMAAYRFVFSPIRYASLSLALLEAMNVGLPLVGLATCELATVVQHEISGFLATDPAALVEPMRALLADRRLAAAIGAAGRRIVQERFHIDRFALDWERAINDVAGAAVARPTPELIAAGEEGHG